jgi:hypothetical protein
MVGTREDRTLGAPSLRTPRAPRARRGPIAKLALALASALIAAVLAEGGHRAWRALAGRPYRPGATADAAREIAAGAARALRLPGQQTPSDPAASAAAALLVLHPYLGYDTQLGVARVGAELALHRARPERFDVLLLGGSVAEIFGELGAPKLKEMLAADPRLAGREPYLLKFARTTYKQPQQQTLLAYLLALGFRPDAVIDIDGFNEVTATAANAELGVHPSYPLGEFWKSIATLGPNGVAGLAEYAELVHERVALDRAAAALEHGVLRYSSVLGEWQLARLRRQQAALQEHAASYLEGLGGRAEHPGLFGPPFEGGEEAAVRLGVECWGEASLSMHAMCAQRGITFLHVLQPTLHDPGSKPMTDEERENARLGGVWLSGTRIGYPLLRAMGEKLRTEGVVFLDATRVFADVHETLYRDACHFDARGNEILAGTIAAALLAALPARLPPRGDRLDTALPAAK